MSDGAGAAGGRAIVKETCEVVFQFPTLSAAANFRVYAPSESELMLATIQLNVVFVAKSSREYLQVAVFKPEPESMMFESRTTLDVV